MQSFAVLKQECNILGDPVPTVCYESCHHFPQTFWKTAKMLSGPDELVHYQIILRAVLAKASDIDLTLMGAFSLHHVRCV
jgi:hypothetical protein